MEEIDKVLEALSVVERYEDYLFIRAWARALVILGTILPLGLFVLINAELLALLTGVDATIMGLFANALALILCWGLVTYTFLGAWRTGRRVKKNESGGSLHAVLIAAAWFICFSLTSYAPMELALVAVLWAASASCILSYIILRLTHSHEQEIVLLYLGTTLGLASLLILIIQDLTIIGIAVPLVFSVCFIAAGVVMNHRASTVLRNE